MEEFHDDLDDDIVGSGFVRGSCELMVLFVDVESLPPFHVQLSISCPARIPVFLFPWITFSMYFIFCMVLG